MSGISHGTGTPRRHGSRPTLERKDRRRSLPSSSSGDGVGCRLPVRAMRTWRTLVLVVAVASAGALGTLLVANVLGMRRSDLAHLLSLLAPATLVTIVAAYAAPPLMRRTSLRQRFVAVALTAAVAACRTWRCLRRRCSWKTATRRSWWCSWCTRRLPALRRRSCWPAHRQPRCGGWTRDRDGARTRRTQRPGWGRSTRDRSSTPSPERSTAWPRACRNHTSENA